MNPEGYLLMTTRVMAEIDGRTIRDAGIPGSTLMENAGQKAWSVVSGKLGKGSRRTVVFVAGNGNNGGDALVMARQCLVESFHTPLVVTTRSQLKGATQEQWKVAERLGLSRKAFESERKEVERIIASADCIVDGVTGTGLTAPLRHLEEDLVSMINAARGIVFSIDLPSGMRDGGGAEERTVVADHTICTGYRKRCLYAPARRAAAGEITWVDPGFPEVEFFSGDQWYPRRWTSLIPDSVVDACRPAVSGMSRDAHKGDRGRLVIVAGGDGTEGAALLAARGATSSGAGMVAVHTTDRACLAGLTAQPEVMWRSRIPGEDDIAWSDAVVVGPGWTAGSVDSLATIIDRARKEERPVVLDAAALRLLAPVLTEDREPLWSGCGPVILTPHPGELADLGGVSVAEVVADPFNVLDGVARSAAWMGAVTIILKASATIIRRSNGDFAVIDGRCPELGTAGSGDVLAGIVGGRLCGRKGAAAAEARAIEGVMEHLLRGRQLARRMGTFSAGQLAEWSIHDGVHLHNE